MGRKALALASGTGAPTVRAGANYNIGKIYETAGDYQQALRYYQQPVMKSQYGV